MNRSYRTVFISDVHLGTSDCQAELLLEFLSSTHMEHLYLVGDIVDLWKARYSIYWPRIKNELAQLILEKAKQGTRITYVPGNHDELLRDFTGSHYSGIDLKQRDVHVTAAGQRLLVIHGDEFDETVRHGRWLKMLGSSLYDVAMVLSRLYNRVRRRLGYSYWSFAAFIKYQFKEAVRYIEHYEESAAQKAKTMGFDGVICGHIHHPNKRTIDGVLYLNTGDWVEHCTALVEDHGGEISLLHWNEARQVENNTIPFSRAA